MEEKTKYNLEHIGDVFVDQIEKVLEALKNSTKGVSLTYRIHCLEKDMEKSYAKIGRRTVALKSRYPLNEVFSDEDMRELFKEFDAFDTELSTAKKQREERLYPNMKTAEEAA